MILYTFLMRYWKRKRNAWHILFVSFLTSDGIGMFSGSVIKYDSLLSFPVLACEPPYINKIQGRLEYT